MNPFFYDNYSFLKLLATLLIIAVLKFIRTMVFGSKDEVLEGKQKVCVIGSGAAGMGAAWALARDPNNKFEVTVIEAADVAGGVATTEPVTLNDHVLNVNDGVQGGTSSYSNTLQILKLLELTPNWVDVKVSFGTNGRQWSNHAKIDNVIIKHQAEIRKFGKVLKTMEKVPFLFAPIKIRTLMWLYGFSDDFANDIIYPLTALFFGTGNQTANVSSTVFGEVFNNPKLRLYEYNDERFLGEAPKMFAFPKFEDYYGKYQKMIEETGNCKFLFNAPVHKVVRTKQSAEVFYGVDEQR